MLLGAAKYLTANKNFNGTVYLIFQPAEEGLGSALEMIKEGLFERFPMDQIFGMHNWSQMPVGTFAILPGPMMAAFSRFTINIESTGGHGAYPNLCNDTVIIAAQLINALQTIVSRNVAPNKTAVVSVTQVHAGDAYNVIPQSAFLYGGVRFFEPEVGALIKQRMKEIIEGIAKSNNATMQRYVWTMRTLS